MLPQWTWKSVQVNLFPSYCTSSYIRATPTYFGHNIGSSLGCTYSLLSRANELLAMSTLRLRAAVGLLAGHTSLRAHLYKLGHTERQECRLCGYEKEDSVHTVCDCPVLARKRCRIWGSRFLKPEDLENVRVGSLLSLVANTVLGLFLSPHKSARRYNGTMMI